MGEVSTQASQRELAIGVLLELAQDTNLTTDDRLAAACAVIDATGVMPSEREQDDALIQVADRVANRVLERIELAAGVTS